MSAGISQCKRKFENKSPDSVPFGFTEEVSLDEDGKESSFSWFCSGIRRRSQLELVNPKNFVAFHVDTLSRTCNLTLAKIPSSIKLMEREYKFHSATLWNVTHYICTFYFMTSGIYMMVSKSIILETLEFKSLIQNLMNHKDIL